MAKGSGEEREETMVEERGEMVEEREETMVEERGDRGERGVYSSGYR